MVGLIQPALGVRPIVRSQNASVEKRYGFHSAQQSEIVSLLARFGLFQRLGQNLRPARAPNLDLQEGILGHERIEYLLLTQKPDVPEHNLAFFLGTLDHLLVFRSHQDARHGSDKDRHE